jgi:hypothetical protein
VAKPHDKEEDTYILVVIVDLGSYGDGGEDIFNAKAGQNLYQVGFHGQSCVLELSAESNLLIYLNLCCTQGCQ